MEETDSEIAEEAEVTDVETTESDVEATMDAESPGAFDETPAIQPSDDVSTPEFPDLKPNSVPAGATGDLNRLFDVQVTVAAELGRKSVPIQKLLGLTEGSVFELDRSVSSPIELVAQGVPLGNGEVVVVDDSFAIRIKEIYAKPT